MTQQAMTHTDNNLLGHEAMHNIEIKFAIPEIEPFATLLASKGATHDSTVHQQDYYCATGENKQKLRVVDGTQFFLISYQRSEQHGKKDSHYDVRVLDTEDKERFLSSQPIHKQVNKLRELWHYQHTHIHLDRVETLGNFLELETAITEISATEAATEFDMIISWLNMDINNSVAASYSDLI